MTIMLPGVNKLYILIRLMLCVIDLSASQELWISPCPRLFSYEPQKENERWFGVVTLTSDTDLKGVWLRVVFDRPSMQLGNWFGEIRTSDNMDYLIHNRNHELKANMPYALRFYITYDPNSPPPQLVGIRLNARPVCPEGQTTTPAAITGGNLLITSAPDGRNPLEGVAQAQRQQRTERLGLDPAQDVQCGVRAGNPFVPLITNGRPSPEGAWPWHIAIYTLNVFQLKYTCGGSLLTKNHVLTAAHCVAIPRSSLAVDLDRFLIHLGRTHLTKFNRGFQQRQLDRIAIHPYYNHSSFMNDLAVLTFSSPAIFSDYVRPICLTTDSISRDLTKELGTVVGWGLDQSNNITELLHETEMPVVDLLTCVYSEPEVFSKLTTRNNFCAGFKNGTSVCNGDSGGGMYFKREVAGVVRWELRGMVSFAIAIRNNVCNPHAYAVFTDVLKFRSWIEGQLQERRQR